MLVKKIKKTALQIACDRKDIKLIKNLIKIGVDINEENFCGETALDIACRNGNTEIIDLLLDAGAELKLRNYSQLMRYLSSKDMFTYKDVFSSFDVVLKDDIITDDKGDTLLHWACNNNDIKTAKMLINGNGVLNIQNGVGDTPLHIACKNDNYKMVKLLLFAGCKLSISNDAGMTPLHIAFYRQNYEIAKMLLEHGANFDIKDNFGRSPLQFIISKNSQPLKILKSNILTLRLLCEKYNFKGIEDFIEKNTSNLYKILAIKFLLSSNLKRYKKIDSFDIRQKNVLLRSIVRQTNVLDALRWSIHNDDFNVFHVILRSPNVTLYDLTTRFGQDMTIIDLAYSVNHHAAEFLKAKKLLLEKNAGWENKHIRKISEQDLDKNNNSSQIQKVSETKPKDSNILKSFLNMFGY